MDRPREEMGMVKYLSHLLQHFNFRHVDRGGQSLISIVNAYKNARGFEQV